MHPSPRSIRARLIPLWIALFSFALGESTLRVFALSRLNSGSPAINAPCKLDSAGFPAPLAPLWFFWWLFLSAVPPIVLAPLIGAVASSRARWWVMSAAALAALGVVGSTAFSDPPNWLGCIGLLSLASAFFSAGRFAVVPEAARQGRLSLPHLQTLLMLAVAAGSGIGIWIGFAEIAERGMPIQLRTAHTGFAVALIALMFARFPSSAILSMRGGLIRPFLSTAKSIVHSRNGRHSLLALWGVFVMLVVLDQWLMPQSAHQAFALAVVIGLIVGGLHGNAYRTLGRVPFASVGLTIGAIWATMSNDWYIPGLGMVGLLGITIVPLLTTYQIHQPSESQGHGAALLFAGCGLGALGLVGFLISMHGDMNALRAVAGYAMLGLSPLAMVFAWLVFFRPAFETAVEWLLWPFYRVRAVGPGAALLPWKGPYVIIANHAAWFDPLWLEKILPAPMTPMMTSRFYDLPAIAWVMRRVVGTIRVPEAAMRRETPEIQQALAALDRGEVLVVFPEGYLRRKESQELRRFGRGIWQIIKARPTIPIFACWIEGNWGSFVSYRGGKPMRNKPIEFGVRSVSASQARACSMPQRSKIT